MRIISQKKLKDYITLLKSKGSADHAAVKAALESWYAEAKKAAWASPAEVKRQYANASIDANEREVVNIKGNDYRMLVSIRYDIKLVFVIWIGTHTEYDNIDVRTVRHVP